ncbi:hypothetical protein [Streptomyces olivaceoviridis]
MTGIEYRQQHGDPATWDDTEYEAFQAWAQPTDQAPTPTDHDLAA